eukprot:GHVO01048517.1.p1 GENE.GHVO01048517.1~~GHVO01048517.1.p1  ORF type:complete len:116 (-),score=10.81 GHVO01048517.1:105-452(-)
MQLFRDNDHRVCGLLGSNNIHIDVLFNYSHADGSLKFWDASAVTLQVLYKLKTAKIFDKAKCQQPDAEDDPFAIQQLFLDPESRFLVSVGLTHLVLFKFSKQEAVLDPSVSVSEK